MAPWQTTDERPHDAGFITPVFAVMTLGLGLVAGAYMMSARVELAAAQRDLAKVSNEAYLEGLSNRAAWALLEQAGSPLLRWTAATDIGEVTISVEPEALKLSPTEAGRDTTVQRLSRTFGADDGAQIATSLVALGPLHPEGIQRADVSAVSSNRTWRRCASTLVSPYSRLTDVALPQPEEPKKGDHGDLRPGQVWRLNVVSEKGWWIDRVVRLTGDPQMPIATIEQDFGYDQGRPGLNCLAALDLVGGLHGSR